MRIFLLILVKEAPCWCSFITIIASSAHESTNTGKLNALMTLESVREIPVA